jgi:hypothetical protein
MVMIYIYNRRIETHNKNDFYIGRGSVLGNPYSHIKDRKTKAIYEAKDRDDAIDKYSYYFDLMYGSNKAFTQAIDEIYEVYKSGDDVFLGCFCKPLRCHGDVIKEKLEKRLLKERLMEKRNKNENIIQEQQMERNLG